MIRPSTRTALSFLLPALLLLLALPRILPVFAADSRVEEEKRRIEQLAKKENRVQARVEGVKKRIKALEEEIATREAALKTVRQAETNATREHQRLMAGKARAEEELRALLVCIWPLRRMDVETKIQGLKTWSEADRRFTWLSSIYEAADRKLALIRNQTEQIAENLERQKALAGEAAGRLTEVNKAKDSLLGEKLALLSDLSTVRAQKKSAEEELRDILNTVSQLRYEETKKTLSMRISAHKGLLPWPALGKVVSTYAPRAKPPRRGIGLSLREGEPVRAVFWGKVVHNDTLRGFGRVVIIYHGQNYYSLYAFLAKSNVRLGQEVEKDEPLGTAGYYPPAGGPGMYFELRFRQKAISPLKWLAQLR